MLLLFTPDKNRGVSTNPACRQAGPPPGRQKKSLHHRRKDVFVLKKLMSGRPGSNRPPRPWQGRALPNELLPLVFILRLTSNRIVKELKGCKNRAVALLKKILKMLICIVACTMNCFVPVLLLSFY